MPLCFNFLITWVNDYGNIAAQVWCHSLNWFFLCLCVCLSQWRERGFTTRIFLSTWSCMESLFLLIPLHIFYLVSCTWLYVICWVLQMCYQSLVTDTLLCWFVVPSSPPTEGGAPGELTGAIKSCLFYVHKLELDTLLIEGTCNYLVSSLVCYLAIRVNNWIWMPQGGMPSAVCNSLCVLWLQSHIYFTSLTLVGILVCGPSCSCWVLC